MPSVIFIFRCPKPVERSLHVLFHCHPSPHPGLLSEISAFFTGGEIQILLEHMDGGSLDGHRIDSEPFLTAVARQVLAELAYLHRQKIVHHNIKPSNLINTACQVKIADFGVSRILAQTMDPCNSSVGTIAFMSPERINTDLNQGIYDGYAGDIWISGLSIMEFYLGWFPFGENLGRQGDWASLMCAICYASPPEASATASREFRSFIACCLLTGTPPRSSSSTRSSPSYRPHPSINHHSSSTSPAMTAVDPYPMY